MYQLLKPFLFSMNAEKAHYTTTTLFKTANKIPIVSSLLKSGFSYEHESLKREVFGLSFKNPVGLAAGFDKNGQWITEMASLGFGFIEVGTVTPKPQQGNPKPRLFRLIEDRAIINRMGFNNLGVDELVKNLKALPQSRDYIIGGNIGKNKVTPNAEAYLDYLHCFKKLYDHVDYFVVNLSSPNTPGLRELQDKKPLTHILSTLIDERISRAVRKPILLKIAPDLTHHQLNDVIDICSALDVDGLIATNTTIDRGGLKTDKNKVTQIGPGGLSGAPLTNRATEVIRYIHDRSRSSVPIIGVGGIDSPQTALSKLDAGAQLIQIYSGLIYSGPYLIKDILKSIVAQLSK